MKRTSFLFLSTAALLVSCSQSKSNETAPASEAPASPEVVELLKEPEAAPAAPAIEIPALPEVVATIDGDLKITGAELQTIVDLQLNRFKAMGLGGDQLAEFTARAREGILEKMVMQKLLQREAEKLNLIASDEEITAYITKNLPAGTSLEDFAKAQGITAEEIKKEVKSGLSVEKLMEKQFETLEPITDEMLQAEYDKIAKEQPGAFETKESVEASHILVKVEKDADEAARTAAKEKLEGIRKQILEGADFAKLAEENSDCPSGKRGGGNLGEFTRGQMVKPFEDAAFTQPLNEVGPVIETDFGYHIIKVTKKTEAKTQTLEDVKEDLRAFVDNKRKGEAFEAFSSKLLDAAKVDINLPKIELPKPEETQEAPRELPTWAQ